ncbi:SoxR reducing system RseC family protein [Reinekea thalattae]|uniref:SoxR reducing system RseC family protein n=1 Tax=Reinekea thalattae TaxID=2593301 RepID=A0A5C8Z4Q3_9GAMM|nr:SoxR reducing system RseC family protein [Reinekea thalattae]TXR53075.1 hypothetical protein FME95_00400 [Reinekea thalattae]
MIKEQGTVVSVEADNFIVAVVRTSACKSCQARQGCGQAVLSEWGDAQTQQAKNHFKVPTKGFSAMVGDVVELEMHPDTVSRVALLVYLLPLLFGLFGLVMGYLFGQHELLQLLFFVSAMGLGYVFLSRLTLTNSHQLVPQIIRTYPASKGVDVIESTSL